MPPKITIQNPPPEPGTEREKKRETVTVACQTDQLIRKGEAFNFVNVQNVQGGSGSGAAGDAEDDDPSGVKPNSVEKYFLTNKFTGDQPGDEKKRCSTQTQSTSQKGGEPDWNDESCKLKLTIENFSKLDDTKYSEGKSIQNVQWKIMVMPKQHMVQKKTQKCMGFFLQCAPENTYSDNWEVHAVADMRLLSFKPEVTHFSRRTTHTYTSKENDWGYSCFMTWADILDESQGYIKNDCVILEIAVKAGEAKHIMKYDQFVQKIEKWMQLADMQLQKGQIDLAIEANSNAISFCKDKDDVCLQRLEEQKQKIVQEKLLQSINRIEKGHEVEAQPVKTQSLKLVLSGAQKSLNGKMSGKGGKKGRTVMTVKQLQKKKEQKAESVEKQQKQVSHQQAQKPNGDQSKNWTVTPIDVKTKLYAIEKKSQLHKQQVEKMSEQEREIHQHEIQEVERELEKIRLGEAALNDMKSESGGEDNDNNGSRRTYTIDSNKTSTVNSVCGEFSNTQVSSVNSDDDEYENAEAYHEGDFGGEGGEFDPNMQELYQGLIRDEAAEVAMFAPVDLPRGAIGGSLSDAQFFSINWTGEDGTVASTNTTTPSTTAAMNPVAAAALAFGVTGNSEETRMFLAAARAVSPTTAMSMATLLSGDESAEKFSPSDRLQSGKNEEDVDIHDKGTQTIDESNIGDLVRRRVRRPAGMRSMQNTSMEQLTTVTEDYSFLLPEYIERLKLMSAEREAAISSAATPCDMGCSSSALPPFPMVSSFLSAPTTVPASVLDAIGTNVALIEDGSIPQEVEERVKNYRYETPVYRMLNGDPEVYSAVQSYLSDSNRGEEEFDKIFDPASDEKKAMCEYLLLMCNANHVLASMTAEQRQSVQDDLTKCVKSHNMYHRMLVTLGASVMASASTRSYRMMLALNAYSDFICHATTQWKEVLGFLTKYVNDSNDPAKKKQKTSEKSLSMNPRQSEQLKQLRDKLKKENHFEVLRQKYNRCREIIETTPPHLQSNIHNKMLSVMKSRQAWFPPSAETKNMKVMLSQAQLILQNCTALNATAERVCNTVINTTQSMDQMLKVGELLQYLIDQEEKNIGQMREVDIVKSKFEEQAVMLAKLRTESEGIRTEYAVVQDRLTKCDRELKTTNGTLKETRTNLKKAETKASKEEARANTIQASLNDCENRVKSLKKDIELLKKSSTDEKNKAKKEKEKDQALIRQHSLDLAAREHERDKAKKELQDAIRAKEKSDKDRKALTSQITALTDRAKAAEVTVLELQKKEAKTAMEAKLVEAKAGQSETKDYLKRARTTNDQELLNKSLSEWDTAVEKSTAALKSIDQEYDAAVEAIKSGAKTLAQVEDIRIAQFDIPKMFRPPPVLKVAPSSQTTQSPPSSASSSTTAIGSQPPIPPVGVIGQPRTPQAARYGPPTAPGTPTNSRSTKVASPPTATTPLKTPTTSQTTTLATSSQQQETNGTSSSSSAATTSGAATTSSNSLWPWTPYDMFNPSASESTESQFNSTLNSFHRNIWAANSEQQTSSLGNDLFLTNVGMDRLQALSTLPSQPSVVTSTPSSTTTSVSNPIPLQTPQQPQHFNPAPGQPIGRQQGPSQEHLPMTPTSFHPHQQHRPQQQHQTSGPTGPPPGHQHIQPRYGDMWTMQHQQQPPPQQHQQQGSSQTSMMGLNLLTPSNHEQQLQMMMQRRQNVQNHASGDHNNREFVNFQGWKQPPSQHIHPQQQPPRNNGYNPHGYNHE